MKKFLYSMLALGAVATMASCSNDDVIEPGQVNPDGKTRVTLNLPEGLSTRAFADGLKARNLEYAVYESGSSTPVITENLANKFAENQLTTTLELTLVPGTQYDIVFFASSPDCVAYTFDPATQSVSVDYAGLGVKDDDRDAFFNHVSIKGGAAGTTTVELRRPFAQINWGTSDLESPAVLSQFGTDLSQLRVQVSTTTYTTLNLLTGEVSGETDVTAEGNIPTGETFPYQPETYGYLAMDYLLQPADASNVDCELRAYKAGSSTPFNTIDVKNVPVRRNFQTNIFGQLLTSDHNFNIVIVPAFDGQYNEKTPLWDGTVGEALQPDENGEYHLNTPADLASLAKMVNDGNNFAKKTVHLNTDIDLGNREWTPIGSETKQFAGVIEGHNHTVHNLFISKATSFAGLVGTMANGQIKNLTINNVHIDNTGTTDANSGTGAFAGNPYTGSASNLSLTGEVQISAFRYVGGMFGHNAYGKYSDLTVDVTPDSYVKATNNFDGFLAAPNHCGGVIGYMGEGNTTLSNVKSNINVISDAAGVGGVVGTAQGGNKFNNCSSSANVTLNTNNNATTALAIGGIAGIHIAGCTFTDCSFTGKLASFLKGVDVTSDLKPANQTCGIQYGGRTAGFKNIYKDVIVNGQPIQ